MKYAGKDHGFPEAEKALKRMAEQARRERAWYVAHGLMMPFPEDQTRKA